MFLTLTQTGIEQPISVSINHIVAVSPYASPDGSAMIQTTAGKSIQVDETYDHIMALIRLETED